jgi:hypothetical protein
VTDLSRVAAHYAMAGPSEGYGNPAEIDGFRIERREWTSLTTPEASVALGRVRVTERVTGAIEEVDVALQDPKAGEIRCRVRTGEGTGKLASARTAIFRSLSGDESLPVSRTLATHFGGRPYGVEAVFLEERRRLLARRADRRLRGLADAPRRQLLAELAETESAAPAPVTPLASPILTRVVGEELAALGAAGPVGSRVDRIRGLVADARSLGITLDLRPELVAPPIEAALGRSLGALRARVTVSAVDDALALVALGRELHAPPGLWTAQNDAVRLWRAGTWRDHAILAPLMTALGFAPMALAAPRGREHGE